MTYEEFDTAYRAFIKSLPGTVNLPQGYLQNCRMWDYWMVMERAGFKPSDVVLDVGALHTFACVFWQDYVSRVVTTDDFSWGERDYAKGLMTPFEWRCVVECLGTPNLRAGHMDLQDIGPAYDVNVDVVLCISTIEHIIHDRLAMLEMMRVLKPGGKLLLTTEFSNEHPKPYSEEDGSWYRVYNDEQIALLTEGLNVTHSAINPDAYGHPFNTLFLEITKE